MDELARSLFVMVEQGALVALLTDRGVSYCTPAQMCAEWEPYRVSGRELVEAQRREREEGEGA